MAGWSGLSLVCFGTPLEAARTTCAGTPDCQAITGEPVAVAGGAMSLATQTATGVGVVYVQPCERIEPAFFSSILPVAVLAAVLILCARSVWRQFETHH